MNKEETRVLLGGMMGMLSPDVTNFHILMDFNIITNHCCVELSGDIPLKEGNHLEQWKAILNYYIKRKMTEYLALHYNKEWNEEYEFPTLDGESCLCFFTENNTNVKAVFYYEKDYEHDE
jgi:hypothetical protein